MFFFMTAMCLSLCFFFFQAEDGIRDIGVTGVQTCALPILLTVTAGSSSKVPQAASTAARAVTASSRSTSGRRVGVTMRGLLPRRGRARGSGEGRVGEKGRSRGGPEHLKKKKEQIECESLSI